MNCSARPVRNVILDCDPGIDDALALAVALSAPELNLTAVTSVFGNVPAETATRNLSGLLALADRRDVPVYAGSAAPLTSSRCAPGSPHAHGFDGLGDVALLAPVELLTVPETHAALHLHQHARALAKQGGVTLLALGPLTNLCLALKLFPDLDLLVDEIIVMGGNLVGPGNHSIAAERNIFRDPEAAAMVLSARWRVRLIGCDVTDHVRFRQNQIARISGTDCFAGHLMSRIGPFYVEYFEDEIGRDEIECHALATIAVLLVPELYAFEKGCFVIETEGISRGKTWRLQNTTDLGYEDTLPKLCTAEICTAIQGPDLSNAVEKMLRR